MKIQPAITTIALRTNPGDGTSGTNNSHLNYVDTAKQLSKINRRLYQQGRLYGYQGLSFIWKSTGTGAGSVATIECKVKTAGNSWIVHNSFVKGKALWDEMQQLVLEDNPSIAGKWHDFKLQLDAGSIAARQLEARDGGGNLYVDGEWSYSEYVMPQHDVDPVTGQPLAAIEFSPVLMGPDTTTKRSLVKAYEESRATVSANQPNTPAGLATSFFNLLTDSGSQEPELATVVEAENDNPPYDLNNYPGGATNGNQPTIVGYSAISAEEVDGHIGPFVAPCGMLQIEVVGYDSNGVEITPENMPQVDILLHVAPGTYKGVAAVPMGQ